MHPAHLSIQDFNYPLSEEKIARHPLADRDSARLLILKDKTIDEDIYRHISEHLPAGAFLVFNNTKVIEARIIFQKPTGAFIEVFALEPFNGQADITTAMNSKERVLWKCLIGGAGKWKRGQILEKQVDNGSGRVLLKAGIHSKLPDGFVIAFNWEPRTWSFAEVLQQAGVMPIPPYLKRDSTAADQENYQTIYARHNGSVAAPTAGLHFTEKVFAGLTEKNIEIDFVTLHVGAGTFMPVKSSTLEGHTMHAEYMEINPGLIQKLIDKPGNIFAVGTTSMRCLESIYWMGVKCCKNPVISPEDLMVKQWEAYGELADQDIEVKDALSALLAWISSRAMQALVIRTQILIAPPYKTKMVRGLITNFHQPNSTLLLLVASLIGDDWHKVYAYALENGFRFLSYGDGCLLYAH